MSHHSTVPNPQADITDLYLFQKPDDPARSILIMNVNPFASRRVSTFSSEVSYEFKIDTNADAEAEIAFHALFLPAANGQQTATVYRAAGETARSTGAVGDIVIRNAPVSFDDECRIAAGGIIAFTQVCAATPGLPMWTACSINFNSPARTPLQMLTFWQ